MIIFGVALLALCTLAGALLGEMLGAALGVKSNVGGVGIAMILLIGARIALARRGLLGRDLRFGIEFWGALYIPIVVAMAAGQNVILAIRSGPLVIIAAILTVAVCLIAVAILVRLGGTMETMDEIEQREAAARDAGLAPVGDPNR
jgi:malonate transporter MadL subunit